MGLHYLVTEVTAADGRKEAVFESGVLRVGPLFQELRIRSGTACGRFAVISTEKLNCTPDPERVTCTQCRYSNAWQKAMGELGYTKCSGCTWLRKPLCARDGMCIECHEGDSATCPDPVWDT